MGDKQPKPSIKKSQADQEGPEFKRFIDPERVLKILQCQRMIGAYIESMIDSKVDIEQLQVGEKFICQHDYDSIVQERFILKLCGYPLCSNTLTKVWNQRYHISLKNQKIYDVEIRKLYCSLSCMNESTNYRDNKIPSEPIWMRQEDITLGPNFEIQKPNP